ncbi:MAG: phage antirepressor KilAC domain-containing protein [Flavobacterium sp.]|nr:phage antirepressor KilAC domain-containing protein [Flavobacterium sp.]
MQLVKTQNQFKHEIFGNLTTITNESGDVFFISNEVSRILDYGENRELLKRIDDDEKLHLTHSESVALLNHNDINSRGIQLLTESGLYSAILGSKKNEAKAFKKWVTSEVLPSIRKNGIYATDITIDKMIADPDFAIQLLTNLKEEKALRLEAEKKNAILMHVNKSYTITEIAKECGLSSAQKLNELLCEKKIQYKSNGTYVPFSQYSTQGYFDIKQEVLDSGRVIYHRRVTQMGREFILNLFK